MSVLGTKIIYDQLNAKQKEIYNFQQVSALFADYGFTTIKLADDWNGADFLAFGFDGERSLKVQLKGRLTFAKKYQNKQLHVCFQDKDSGSWYLYDHDLLLKEWLPEIEVSESWKIADGAYTFPGLSDKAKQRLEAYQL